MYLQNVPFRTYLSDSAITTPEQGKEHLRLCKLSRNSEKLSADEMLSLATSPWESHAWALVCDAQSRDREGELVLVLVKRALSDAEKEGVAWTPLIDALARRGFWAVAQKQDGEIPSLDEVVAPLGEWIAKEKSRESLEWLSEFSATQVKVALGRYALDPDEDFIELEMEKDARVGLGLAVREDLDEKLRGELAFWAWDHVCYMRRQQNREYGFGYSSSSVVEREDFTKEAMEALEILATSPEGLPSEFREETLSSQERREAERRDQGMLALLLQDPTLSEEDFRRVASMCMGGASVQLILNTRCTSAIRDEALERDPTVAARLVREKDVDEETLSATIQYFSKERDRVQDLLRHPNCPVWFARQQLTPTARRDNLLGVMAYNPRLRADKEIYDYIFESKSREALSALLATSKDESEATHLWQCYAGVDARGALRMLETKDNRSVPAALKLRETDLAPLLAHSEMEIRVSAMAAAAKLRETKESLSIEGRQELDYPRSRSL